MAERMISPRSAIYFEQVARPSTAHATDRAAPHGQRVKAPQPSIDRDLAIFAIGGLVGFIMCMGVTWL